MKTLKIWIKLVCPFFLQLMSASFVNKKATKSFTFMRFYAYFLKKRFLMTTSFCWFWPCFHPHFANLITNHKLMKAVYVIYDFHYYWLESHRKAPEETKKYLFQEKIFFNFFPWFSDNLAQNIWDSQKKIPLGCKMLKLRTKHGFFCQSKSIS